MAWTTTPWTLFANTGLAVGDKIEYVIIETINPYTLNDILVICGGVIPAQDYKFLKDAGVKAIFGPGTNIPKAAEQILKLIRDGRK